MAETKKVKLMPERRALSQDDLQEFRLRHQALLIAAHQHTLVKEAYDQWIAGKGREYGMKGKFNINLQSGELKPDA